MQILDAGARIAPERDLGLDGAADLLGHDLEMDDALAARRHGVALGRDLAELAADDEEEIGLRDQPVGDAVIAAEKAGAQRIDAGDRALAGHRVGDRDREGLRERRERAGGARKMHAAARQHDRPLGASASKRAARSTAPASGRQRSDGAA